MTDRVVFMFPGQGSQVPGMRQGLGPAAPEVEELFERAEELLGIPLRDIIDGGPLEELTRTSVAQPALLVTGFAAALALRSRGHCADIVLGHSLGEYTALAWAGVLGFEDAVRLVRARGLLMEQASENTPGGMVAVVRVELEQLEAVVSEIAAAHGVLEITNINGPGNVVISGEHEALNAAVLTLKERRLGRAIPLTVSAPFHCSLMAPMAQEFSRLLDNVPFAPPRYTFIDNVTGQEERDPDRIRAKLVDQLTSPVLWTDSVDTAWSLGGRVFIECGPKAVLQGLVRRIHRGAELKSSEKLLPGSAIPNPAEAPSSSGPRACSK
jgi:[acyl-carrier-protein] S-malonyltransferase